MCRQISDVATELLGGLNRFAVMVRRRSSVCMDVESSFKMQAVELEATTTTILQQLAQEMGIACI